LNDERIVKPAAAYRPDIDGLRAIAVISVWLFHAGVPGFSGGYVGVDVFFVISGYLITQLLDGSRTQPLRRWLAEFYLRRARRILPALFVMVLVVAVPATAIFLPWDLQRFGNSVAATAVLLTNVAVWWAGIGYFQSTAVHATLTHLWSIAVEEQFYLLYPLTLFMIRRYLPRHRTYTLMVLALASFALCVWGSYYRPRANFFLAPSRAWELLLGALIATTAISRLGRRLTNELLAAVSLLALAYAIHRYQSATPYPGLYALAPCAASAALIVTARGQTTLISRLLSTRLLVFTGLISYSFYLWHLPILELFSYYNILDVSPFELGVLFALTYAIAAMSWRLVEKPIRARQFLKSDRAFILTALAINTLMLGGGVLLWKSGGLPQRFSPELRAWGLPWLTARPEVLKCMNLPADRIASGDLCSFGSTDTDAPKALIWGDSHALALLPAFEKLAASRHVRLYVAVRFSCRPLPGLTDRIEDAAAHSSCASFNAAVMQAVRRLEPRLVILNAQWVEPDTEIIPRSDLAAEPGESEFGRGLRAVLQQIDSTKRSVCVVLDVPTLKYQVPYSLGVTRKRGIAEDFLTMARAEVLEQYRIPERDFRAFERRGELTSVDPKDLLCRADKCLIEANGNLLYGDRDHLNAFGAQFVSSAIEPCFGAVDSGGSK
jgi:peptidoglycan/LPS O-acetylase OafA/YrhL